MVNMTELKSKFLNKLKSRGYIQDCTNFDGLDEYFYSNEQAGTPAIAYIGFDCTGRSLHIGSLMQIMIFKHLQDSGHKPIVLLGGGTTRIGDPSGKDETRKILSDEDIEANKQGIKKVFEKYIEFENEFNPKTNKAFLVDNDEWLSKLNYIQFLRDVGRHFSVNRMLSFDSVKMRLEREQNLSFIEFNYMILQAYDFVKLANKYNCRLQIGGSDQWGNIVNGTELWRRTGRLKKIKPHVDNLKNEFDNNPNLKRKLSFKQDNVKFTIEKEGSETVEAVNFSDYDIFGLTTPLLTTSNGAKMGKTADGAIWLDAEMLTPYDFWQYWRNTSDADTIKFIKLFTLFSDNEIAEFEKLQGAELNQAKIKLATHVTKLCHGEAAANKAEQTAKQVFEQGGTSDNLPICEISKAELEAGISAVNLLKNSGLCESNGEAKKLIAGGGAKINDEKITANDFIVNSAHLKDGAIKLSSGKKKHILVKVK